MNGIWASLEGLSIGSEQVRPPKRGSPGVIRYGARSLAGKEHHSGSLLSSPQSNASHLLLMLFPQAHLQIAWIKHQSREGGAVLWVFHYCLCHIPPLLPFSPVPSPFITLINNLYLIGLSWNSQTGLLGSCRDGEETDSGPTFVFVFCFPGWMVEKSKPQIHSLREAIWE